MPGIYRKKQCPTCGMEHRKKGPYCSQGCANSDREVTEETRNKLSAKLNEYAKTPEGIAKAKRAAIRLSAFQRGVEHELVTLDEFAVDIPTITALEDYDDIIGGYQRGEDW